MVLLAFAIRCRKLWARVKKRVWYDGYRICSALNGLHEIHMKALRTPRCITHLNMRAIRRCAGCCLEASTNGFIWRFKVRDYRES